MSKIFYYPMVLIFFILFFSFVNSLTILPEASIKMFNLGILVVLILWLSVSAVYWGR